MKTIVLLLLALVTAPCFSQNNSYQKAWNLLNENKREEASKLLAEAMKDPSTAEDAYITHLYLQTYNGKEREVTDFINGFYNKVANPYPYVFSLWFNNAVLGDYGKKEYDFQVKLTDLLMNDAKAPGTLNAAAAYQRGMHELYSNNIEKAQTYYGKVNNIQNWQFVGPFENLSKSGFFKNYGPLDHPEPTAVFKSVTNADIQWFSPTSEDKDGWTPTVYQFSNSTAVVYAQTFVTVDADKSIHCNIGFTGAVKLWINDELILSDPKEKTTELDALSAKATLKKGNNRLLVQLSYSNTSYPNFSVRFTDENKKPLSGINGTQAFTAYPKLASTNTAPEALPHFAEAYFLDKIKTNKSSFVNYLLLADAYLRNNRIIEARNSITDALKMAPNNSLLRMKLLQVLIKEDNRTMMLEELEKIKRDDPTSLTVMDLKIKEYLEAEKYEDMAAELKKRIALHGVDRSTDGYNVLLLIQEKKYEEMIKEAEKLYVKYPNDEKVVGMMYGIKKDVYKNKKDAIKVYENYMKNNFNYSVYEDYAQVLSEQGNTSKSLKIREELANLFAYNPYGFKVLADYHYGAKQYEKAEEYTKVALGLSPYNESYWSFLGDIYAEKDKKTEAMAAYTKSLMFDPKQYEILSKMRKLQGKPEITKLLAEVDVNKVIQQDNQTDAKNTDYGYYYILDQKDVVIYPGGAAEEYVHVLIRITNEKGIDRYKESSIGYANNQSLLIEKAEIIKKNQSRLEGERNDNVVVFTNLEVGDILVFKYRIQNYNYGRFAKDFWDRYYFGSQLYTAIAKYNILTPTGIPLYYQVTNSTIKPAQKEIEDMKVYSWELKGLEPLKDEPLAPNNTDIGEVLHISTVPNWNDIANWYSDLTNNNAENDFEIIALYKQLFPNPNEKMSDIKKATIIYNYIESNIRYSSVSFRQSAYVPQQPSTTLITRLGDCKDLSALFVTLAQMAGIQSQLVLVNTRDNGEKEMELPSLEFNHCIAKAKLDNKDYYIELTDNYLPFGSLPNNLNGAMILDIPYRRKADAAKLVPLKTPNRTRDIVKRKIEIKPDGSDLAIDVITVKYGHNSSSLRSSYGNLEETKQREQMEKSVAGGYKNIVKLSKIAFGDLTTLSDSVSYTYSYKVKNEISEIGSMNTFRVVYPDIVASLNNFSADERTYPIEYWNYEDVDLYETVVIVTAPTGKKFVELPESETLTYKDSKFSLQYKLLSPDKLVITRKFSSERTNIPAAEYLGFKSFFEKIVKAEQKFIAYK